MPKHATPSPAGHRRFSVGVDLGTTNSVVAFVDTAAASAAGPQILDIPQLMGPGLVEIRPLLPSFLYLPLPDEFPTGALSLPWGDDSEVIVGDFARRRGTEVTARLVASAKSWLSHTDTDRTAPILPWGAADDVPKRSPLDVSALYLSHIRHAWNTNFPGSRLEDQDVFLTVPASFDAVARDLTVRAAHQAGLPHLTLLEEPQAAFYAWIDANGDRWRDLVRVGDRVLVCDVGGGTTDFSLIAVREQQGTLGLERVAVGDHILLGGDNMDLALAFGVRDRLTRAGTPLDGWQFRSLTLACREAKERLLSESADATHPVAIPGRGRKVIGGTLRAEIDRTEVHHALVDGFFPRCRLADRPQAEHRTALQELGLPYATDPAVTRHLASFLTRHGSGSHHPNSQPTAVLFNGGVMGASTLRERLVEVVNDWFGQHGANGLRVLTGGKPEHAVARGAAYYGLARRGRGVRIRGGTARAYYLGIESAMPAVPGVRPPIKALCIVPHGLEEGTEVELPAREFGLVVGDSAEFRFLGSSTRPDDRVGTLLESWDADLTELAPLQTALDWEGQEGATVPVRLQARVTEVGILELWCVSRDGNHRWKLEFNVRSPS